MYEKFLIRRTISTRGLRFEFASLVPGGPKLRWAHAEPNLLLSENRPGRTSRYLPLCCSMSSRYASQVLRMAGFAEKGAIKSVVTSLAGFASPSGVTSLAGLPGFAFPRN